MNEKPSEPRKEIPVELGQPSFDRQTINRVYGLFFPGAHSLREPRLLIEEIVDSVKKGGWPDAVSQSGQEEFLNAALRISREWPEDDPLIDDLARLLREYSRQIAA